MRINETHRATLHGVRVNSREFEIRRASLDSSSRSIDRLKQKQDPNVLND